MPTIGLFGGGEAAKMIVQAASILNVETVIFATQEDEPALKIAPRRVIGSWNDEALLTEFAQQCDLVTLQDGAVPLDVLKRVDALGATVMPSLATLDNLTDKLLQKRKMQQLGLPTPRFDKVMVGSDILEAASEFGFPLLLKTRTERPEGTDSVLIRRAHDVESALETLSGQALLVEDVLTVARELSMVLVRGQDGEMRNYPVSEITQQNGALYSVLCPASVEEETAYRAMEIAVQAVQALEGVGVFHVALYETADGEVLLKDIAPYPHNAGYYTIEGIITSQFENHLRAVLGWPLGDVAQIAPATAMLNIVAGPHAMRSDALPALLSVGGTHVHWYGKPHAAGRKMGHITVLGYNTDGAEKVGRLALSKLDSGNADD